MWPCIFLFINKARERTLSADFREFHFLIFTLLTLKTLLISSSLNSFHYQKEAHIRIYSQSLFDFLTV